MSLLNKEEKSAAIYPMFQGSFRVWGQNDLGVAMRDKTVYRKWLDLMSSKDNIGIRLDEWMKDFHSIVPNFILKPDIIYTHDGKRIIIYIHYTKNGIRLIGLTIRGVLDDEYPQDLIEKIIQDSKHSGTQSDID